MTTLTLLADHPFFEFAKPTIYQQSWNKRWCVYWRDFSSIKQDAEFGTEREARVFAATINQPPLTITDDEEGGGYYNGMELGEADRYWRTLKTESKSGHS